MKGEGGEGGGRTVEDKCPVNRCEGSTMDRSQERKERCRLPLPRSFIRPSLLGSGDDRRGGREESLQNQRQILIKMTTNNRDDAVTFTVTQLCKILSFQLC